MWSRRLESPLEVCGAIHGSPGFGGDKLSEDTSALVTRIVPRLEQLATEPRPPGCKKLRGGDKEWRIRIGDYRVGKAHHAGGS